MNFHGTVLKLNTFVNFSLKKICHLLLLLINISRTFPTFEFFLYRIIILSYAYKFIFHPKLPSSSKFIFKRNYQPLYNEGMFVHYLKI